jgi:hypothetical protein
MNNVHEPVMNQPWTFHETSWTVHKGSWSYEFHFAGDILFQHVLNRQYLLWVINSSQTFGLTFTKLCTVVMDTLKMCMWLFWSASRFFKKFTCSWTLSFLAHLSWKLKWAILIARCPSVRPSVCKLLHFRLLLQNHWANFNQTWHKSSLGGGDYKLLKWRGLPFSKGR